MGDVMAVIQAGGRGTRLAPYSTVLPKALMPIGDGTVIDTCSASSGMPGSSGVHHGEQVRAADPQLLR